MFGLSRSNHGCYFCIHLSRETRYVSPTYNDGVLQVGATSITPDWGTCWRRHALLCSDTSHPYRGIHAQIGPSTQIVEQPQIEVRPFYDSTRDDKGLRFRAIPMNLILAEASNMHSNCCFALLFYSGGVPMF